MYYKKESDLSHILLFIIISFLVAIAVYSFMRCFESDEDYKYRNRYRKYDPIKQEQQWDIQSKD